MPATIPKSTIESIKENTSIPSVLKKYHIKPEKTQTDNKYEMSRTERNAALEYLMNDNLLKRIAKDIETYGIFGNKKNNLLAYLGSLSRLTESPCGVLIVPERGAGKNCLQAIINSFVPEESLIKLTCLTNQTLFYLSNKQDLKHDLLAIEENEGIQKTMYAISLLLSGQELRLHSLKSDSKTGELTTLEKTVEGPTSVMLTTTDLSRFDHENISCFFVLHPDKSRKQTMSLSDYKKKITSTEKSNPEEKKAKIRKLHRNIQRLINPIHVVNNIWPGINYPNNIIKIKTLINTIALLHQHQRKIKEKIIFDVKTRYIEVEKKDVEAAFEIAGDSTTLKDMPDGMGSKDFSLQQSHETLK